MSLSDSGLTMAINLQRNLRRYLLALTTFLLIYVLLFALSSTLIQDHNVRRQQRSIQLNKRMQQIAGITDQCPVDLIGQRHKICNDPQSDHLTACTNNITCKDLLTNSDNSVYYAVRSYMKTHQYELEYHARRTTYRDFKLLTSNCAKFLHFRGYVSQPLSAEEADFPIAFNIITHKDIELFERLLRSIYHPQNSYCVHLDAKSPRHFSKMVKRIVSCLPNVFIASKLEQVVYRGYSRLQADINCMRDHLKSDVQWKYLLNVAGQSFPLKTNYEMVKILKIYNGSNDIEGLTLDKLLPDRFEYQWLEVDNDTVEHTNIANPDPPHNLQIVRGSAYGVFSRGFVEYVTENPVAKDFLKWSEKTFSPDEHFWATLNHNGINPHLNVPGAYTGNHKNEFQAVYVKWKGVHNCHGIRVRDICVFGVEDLPDLIMGRAMFANKFYLDYQPLALDCLESWMKQKTICPPDIDTKFYSSLSFVRQSQLS